MQENSMKQSEFNSSNLIALVMKWKKQLLIVAAVALVVSTVVAFFIVEPKFKSTVVLFPASTASISKSLLILNPQEKDDILKFGEEAEAEQLLQILNSDEIRDRICKKYNLMNHYEISPNERYKYTKLYDEYDDNISFRRTELMSVKIEVLDKDPQIACDIANDISSLLDTIKNKVQHERAMMGLKIVQGEYYGLKQEIKEIEDSLKVLRQMGINDYESQSAAFNEQYATALVKGNSPGIKQLEEKIKILSEYGGAYLSMGNYVELLREQLSLVKAKYQEAKVDAEKNIAAKFVINKGFKAEKKSYPIRWLVILASVISSLLFALLFIIGYENYYQINKK
jgi:capsular polysaccharide biosynthesis protein